MTKNNKSSGNARKKQGNKSLIRQDLVEYYKKKIALGEYVLHSDEIAEKIVQNIKEQPVKKTGHAYLFEFRL